MNAPTASHPTINPTARPNAGTSHWPLERVLFAMAGTMSVLSAALAAFVSPWFLLLTVVVGVNQWLYVAFRGCPASLVLTRLGVKSQCKW